jgi:hypothetical protein
MEQCMNEPVCNKQIVRQGKDHLCCHSEFISESLIRNILYKQQILKQVQDDGFVEFALTDLSGLPLAAEKGMRGEER